MTFDLCCSDSYIVRVTAVVMTRDESSGGWLALDGCLSRVGVCRLRPNGLQGRNSFLIHGERLKDRQVGSVGTGSAGLVPVQNTRLNNNQ